MNNNINPFHYTPQNLRDFDDHSYNYNDGEVVVYKPEPLSLNQGISLSLSSPNNNNDDDDVPLELNLQRYESADMYSDKVTASGYVVSSINICASPSDDVSRISSVPVGPFTGYALILKGSSFLKPAQMLLEELCDVGSREIVHADKMSPDYSLMEPLSMHNLSAGAGIMYGGDGGTESIRNKSRLISMLDEVYRRYKQYYQQMQAVVASFEYVSGLGNAAPYANLALKTMSKHFRCLRNAITDQLQFTDKANGQIISPGKDEGPRFGSTDRNLYNRPLNHNSGFLEHQPVWRPHRGLPERAVTALRAWLFEHFLHPYPTDTEKLMLAKQTGLSRSQVSNWFINARVRLWKPMVEEIHMLETRQAQKGNLPKDRNENKSTDHLCSSENPSTSGQRVQTDIPSNSKRTRSELPDIPLGSEPVNLSSYNSLSRSSHPHNVGVGISMAGGSNGGVSLTLGLHQNNNGIGLSERFPINAAQRFSFGLEVSGGEGYDIGGFETQNKTQNRHFGRDVLGGQLLHDFVG